MTSGTRKVLNIFGYNRPMADANQVRLDGRKEGQLRTRPTRKYVHCREPGVGAEVMQEYIFSDATAGLALRVV